MSATLAGELPVYELEILATEIAFEVRVNDLPALRLPVGRVQTTFDVNPYVEQGKNTLSVVVKPRVRGRDFSEHASCKVQLRRKPHPESDAAEVIGTLVFSGYGVNAVTGFAQSTGAAGGGPIEVERFGAKGILGFVLDPPFGPWAWSTAEKLIPTEQLRAEVLAELRRIHGLLARRDAATLMARCALQAADYQQAYYLPSLEQAYELLGISALLLDPTIEVDPFPDAILTLELLGGGRLVQLVDDDGNSPLRIRSTEVPEMRGRFNAVLCRTAQGWQIAR